MALDLKAKQWPGAVREVTLGAGTRQPLTLGGGRGLPLHSFDGLIPRRPLLALEVTGVDVGSWPPAVRQPWSDALGQPAVAARRAVSDFGADLVVLNLTGTHPDRGDRTADQAVADVRAVLDAVTCPLVVKGPGAGARQNEVLSRVAEAAAGERLALHAATRDDYKTLAAVAVAYGHVLVAESPIDVNIAKQLDILLSEASVDLDDVLIDPLTGALGYGLEYTYSVMERIRLAALAGEAMLSSPVVCLVGEEAWKAKEAKTPEAKEPAWGPEGARGVAWEVATALSLLLAGADLLVLRHPESLARVRGQLESWFPTAPGATAAGPSAPAAAGGG